LHLAGDNRRLDIIVVRKSGEESILGHVDFEGRMFSVNRAATYLAAETCHDRPVQEPQGQ